MTPLMGGKGGDSNESRALARGFRAASRRRQRASAAFSRVQFRRSDAGGVEAAFGDRSAPSLRCVARSSSACHMSGRARKARTGCGPIRGTGRSAAGSSGGGLAVGEHREQRPECRAARRIAALQQRLEARAHAHAAWARACRGTRCSGRRCRAPARARTVGAIRGVPERVASLEQQVEARIPGRIGFECPQVVGRRGCRCASQAGIRPPREGALRRRPPNRGSSSRRRSGARVERRARCRRPAGRGRRSCRECRPRRERRRRALVILVAIGRDDEPVARMAAPRED